MDNALVLLVVGGIMLVIIIGVVFLSTEGKSRHERFGILQGMLGFLIFIFIQLVGGNQTNRVSMLPIGIAFLVPLAIIAGALGGNMIVGFLDGNRTAAIIAGMVSGLSCLLIPYFYGQYHPKPSDLELGSIYLLTLLLGSGLYAWMRKWKWLQPDPATIGIQPALEQPIDLPLDQIPSQQLEFASDKPGYKNLRIKTILMNISIIALLVFEVFGLGIGTFLYIVSLLGCKRVTLFSFFHNPSIDVLIGAFCWVIIWLLARRTGNPFAVYGFGTHFYGHTPTSNGYIATKWVTIGFFPALPVRSYEIYGSTEPMRYLTDFQATSYWMRPLQRLEMSQVVRVGWIGYGILAGLGILLSILLHSGC